MPSAVLFSEYELDPAIICDDLRRVLINGQREVRTIDFPLITDQLATMHALLDCSMTGQLRERYLQAKLSELTCLTLSHLAAPRGSLSHS